MGQAGADREGTPSQDSPRGVLRVVESRMQSLAKEFVRLNAVAAATSRCAR